MGFCSTTPDPRFVSPSGSRSILSDRRYHAAHLSTSTTRAPMRILGVIAVSIFASTMFSGCASSTLYYTESNLNRVSVGASKDTLLKVWRSQDNVPGLVIRAARRTESGMLLEVGELALVSDEDDRVRGGKKITAYWFLFENGRLVQWGRPEDWRAVSQRYDIHFNPSPGVPR